ncbi:DUF6584 family protein [Allorhizocola rhizosphaerae]|uniref:DUF6584 family protein n=1 Tax=Allorhizocola rhizosphaerae TaxID=1872709 RepID=UPI0013C29F49|nr:DUF6584 family protein [Allorhizocola rhizosphaerae]
MAKSNLMDRVANDLAKGHTHPAKQRLHSLIAAHPTDLDLRRQLAEVYRQTGDLVEAGRWSYLDEAADPVEILAFERAYPSPAGRRAALRWPANALPPTDFVRRRLAELPPPRTIAAQAQRMRLSIRLNWMRLSAAAVLCGLAAIGLYAVVEQLVR